MVGMQTLIPMVSKSQFMRRTRTRTELDSLLSVRSSRLAPRQLSRPPRSPIVFEAASTRCSLHTPTRRRGTGAPASTCHIPFLQRLTRRHVEPRGPQLSCIPRFIALRHKQLPSQLPRWHESYTSIGSIVQVSCMFVALFVATNHFGTSTIQHTYVACPTCPSS